MILPEFLHSFQVIFSPSYDAHLSFIFQCHMICLDCHDRRQLLVIVLGQRCFSTERGTLFMNNNQRIHSHYGDVIQAVLVSATVINWRACMVME